MKIFTFKKFGRALLLAAVLVAVSVGTASAQQKVTFTDKRDGTKYKTVAIGNQTWMAENLRFILGDSWCYENDESKCQQYGRLYDWNMARIACPKGWHLPTKDEWTELVAVVGSVTGGKKLKSTSGWNGDGNGTDDFGFSALPGGLRVAGSFGYAGSRGYWWSATESGGGGIYYIISVRHSRISCEDGHGGA